MFLRLSTRCAVSTLLLVLLSPHGADGRKLFDQSYIIDAGNTGGAFGIPTFIAGPPQFLTLQVSYGLR